MRAAIFLVSFLSLLAEVFGVYNCDTCNQVLGLLNSTNLVMLTDPLFFMDSNQIPTVIYSVYSQDDNNELRILKCSDPLCKSNTDQAFYTFSNSGSQELSISGALLPDNTLFFLVIPSTAQSSRILYGHCQDKLCNRVNLPNMLTTIDVVVYGSNVMTFPNTAQPILTTFLAESTQTGTLVLGIMSCNDTNCNKPVINATNLNIYPSQPSALVGTKNSNGLPLFTFVNSQTLYILLCSDIMCSNSQINSVNVDSRAATPPQLLTHPKTHMPYIGFNTGDSILGIQCFDMLCVNNTMTTIVESYQVIQFGITFGPDGYLYYSFYNMSTHNFIHCEDADCNKTSQFQLDFTPHVWGNDDTIQLITSDIVYAMINYQQLIMIVPLCGPFLKGFSPNDAIGSFESDITVTGNGFCPNLYCQLGDAVNVTTEYQSATSIICKVPANTLSPGNYSLIVGDKDFIHYGAISGTINYFDAIMCPKDCNGNGKCDYLTGVCSCNKGYYREDCSVNFQKLGTIVIAVVISLTIVIIIVLGILFFKRVKPQRYDKPAIFRRNFTNLVSLVAVPIEFFQLVVFGLNLKSEWTGKIYNGASVALFNFPSVSIFIVFWTVFILTALWCISMFPFFIKRNGKLLIEDLLENRTFQSLYSWTFIILVPFCTFLQLSIIGTFLRMVSCHYWNTELPLLNKTDLICWESPTLGPSLIALFMFFLFFPMAVYAFPILQSLSVDSDLFYYNRFIFIQQAMYILLTVADNLFIDFEVFRIIFAIIVSIVLLVTNIEMKPCNIDSVNTIRTASYIVVVLSAIMSLWAIYEPPTYRVPLIVFCVGVCVVLFGLFIVLSGRLQKKLDKTSASLVQAFSNSHNTENTPLINNNKP